MSTLEWETCKNAVWLCPTLAGIGREAVQQKESSERENILISPPDKAWKKKKKVWLKLSYILQATNKLQATFSLDLTTLKVYTSESFSSARSVQKSPPSSLLADLNPRLLPTAPLHFAVSLTKSCIKAKEWGKLGYQNAQMKKPPWSAWKEVVAGTGREEKS